jgi:HAD superfamily hydrolase (TIGR01490 family)
MEAAFFDLDKTVIATPSMVAFGRPLYDAGMITRAVIVRALWSNFLFQHLGADEERMRKFRHSALRITRGWDQALVSAVIRDTLVEVIEPIVYAEALDLIQEHRRVGRRVFLVSASPEEIVAPLAQFLGVDEAIASRAELDEEGRYTGRVEFWSYGPYKVEAIEALAQRYGIDLDRSFAYSDSATDVPMLETVGHPVAVNPDRDLARIARERGWETRWFEHPVPLRSRVNMPRPGRATVAVAGGLAVLGVAGVVTWWWIDRRVAPSVPAPIRPAGRLRQGAAAATWLTTRSGAATTTAMRAVQAIGRPSAASTPVPPGTARAARSTRRPGGSWETVRRPAASSPRNRRERAVQRSR